MKTSFKQALENRRFFKLICGASYRNPEFVSRLSEIYAAAGAHMIDIGATPELVRAARKGIVSANPPLVPGIMISVGINDDVHFMRVKKDFDRCDAHGFCANACPHEVFVGSEIRLQNCLGCDHCVIACPESALSLVPRDPLTEVVSRIEACLDAGATALEIHTGDGGREELRDLYSRLSPLLHRLELLAFSLGAHGQDEGELLALARDIEALAGQEIIIQADGNPISGRKGKNSARPGLELAQKLFSGGVKAFVQVSGGANDWSGPLSRELNIPIHGVGMGSFARKYLNLSPSQTLSDTEKEQYILKAKQLVLSIGA